MNNILNAFIISSIAGLSTLIGTLVIFIKTDKYLVGPALAFAAGVMFTVSVIDLLPSAYNIFQNHYFLLLNISIIFLFIMIGFLLSTYLGRELTMKVGDNKLLRLGLLSLLAIIFHNIPEGIATFLTSNNNLKLGITLAIAITMHNIPEGISIALPIFYATKSRGKAILYSFIAGISEICGSIIAFIFLRYINDIMMGMLYAIIAGIMINISMSELFPVSFYNNKRKAICYYGIGVIFMLIVHFLLI